MSGDAQREREQTHTTRYLEIIAALRRHGLGFAADMLGLSSRRAGRGSLTSDGESAGATAAAAHLRAVLEELGPTFIKLGQLLSTREDLLPPVFITELAKLQDGAPPVPTDATRSVVRDELGADADTVFASFDDAPLASASIGQAHTATLADGTAVVVKVRKPGAVARVRTDVEILKNLARRAEQTWQFAHDVDVIGIVDEFATTITAELDYLQEGTSAERFAENFADDESVVIPQVFWEHTTSRVLTLERMSGINVSDAGALDDAGIDRHLVAASGADAILRMIFRDGFFHADLHPGNLFIRTDNTIALIDFGMVGTISDKMREHIGRLFIAMVERDADALAGALIDISTRTVRDRVALRDELRPFLARYPLSSVRKTQFARMITDLFTILRGNQVRLPRELVLLFKTLMQVESLAVQLDPDFDLGEALAPYAARIQWERLRPSTVLRRVATATADFGEAALRLPSIARRLAEASDSGLEVHLRAAELDPLMGRAEKIANRLVTGMIGAALITGIGGLVSSEKRWRSWEGTMLGAGLGAIGAIGAYLALTARRRR